MTVRNLTSYAPGTFSILTFDFPPDRGYDYLQFSGIGHLEAERKWMSIGSACSRRDSLGDQEWYTS